MKIIQEIREEPKFVVELTEREIMVLLASVARTSNPQIREYLQKYKINVNIDSNNNDIALLLYKQFKNILHLED